MVTQIKNWVRECAVKNKNSGVRRDQEPPRECGGLRDTRRCDVMVCDDSVSLRRSVQRFGSPGVKKRSKRNLCSRALLKKEHLQFLYTRLA